MSDISRRDALRRLGLVLAATGFVDRAAAQEVHQMAGEARAATAVRNRDSHASRSERSWGIGTRALSLVSAFITSGATSMPALPAQERFLHERFGAPYDDYTRRVRRWL
jgi:hypothetical protein